MNFEAHTTPERLERYAFFWTEARLLIASLSLIFGGAPIVYNIFGFSSIFSGLINTLLGLSWIISGLVSGYLFYRWHRSGMKLFDGTDTTDTFVFGATVVTGINLGIAGLTKTNIGMLFSSSHTLYVLTGIGYLATALYLYRRWKRNDERLFPYTTSSKNSHRVIPSETTSN